MDKYTQGRRTRQVELAKSLVFRNIAGNCWKIEIYV